MTFNKSSPTIEKIRSVFSTEQAAAIFTRFSFKKQNASPLEKKGGSPYGNMLRESRKISLLYGNLPQKYLQKIFRRSGAFPSRRSETIFSILESRLDVVLYRAAFFESILAAKQMIRWGQITVNRKKVISPGYIVAPGDLIRVLDTKKSVAFAQRNRNFRANLLQQVEKPKLNRFQSVETLFPKLDSTLNLQKEPKMGWRFQHSIFLPSLLCKSKSKKVVTLLKKAFQLNLISPKSKIYFQKKSSDTSTRDESLQPRMRQSINKKNFGFLYKNKTFNEKKLSFSLSDENDKKNNLPFLSLFIKENILNRFSFGDSNPFFSEKKEKKENIFTSHIRALKWKVTDFYKEKEKSFIKEKQTILKSNEKSRLFKELSFLYFYQKKIKLKSEFKENCTKREGNEFSKMILAKDTFLSLSNTFLFSNYIINLRKQFLLRQKKNNYFAKQQEKLFFKDQLFRDSKKSKPLHLEIGYTSLSIIFLFPPQRICFPTFINPSLIYK